jgi:hypothetical protein
MSIHYNYSSDQLCQEHVHETFEDYMTRTIPKYGDMFYKWPVPLGRYDHIKCQACRDMCIKKYERGIITIHLPSIGSLNQSDDSDDKQIDDVEKQEISEDA